MPELASLAGETGEKTDVPELGLSSGDVMVDAPSLSTVAENPPEISALISEVDAMLDALPSPSVPPTTNAATMSFFPFLSLPLELRQQVYSQLLLHPLFIEVSHAPPYFPWVFSTIILVSRQIHSEAAHVLYSSNMFYLHYHSRFFLDVIGETNRNTIRKLRIDWGVREEYQTGFKKLFSILPRMKSLKEVVVMIDGDKEWPQLDCMRGWVRGYGMVDILDGEFEKKVPIRGDPTVGKPKIEFRMTGEHRGMWVTPHVFNCDGVTCARFLHPPPSEPPPPRPCKILLLPCELRQKIYEYLIPVGETIDLRQHLSEVAMSHPPNTKAREYINVPKLRPRFGAAYAFLLTCRLFSVEVCRCIYSKNKIRVYSDALHVFDIIGSSNFTSLRNVEIYYELEELLTDPDDGVILSSPIIPNTRPGRPAKISYRVQKPPPHSFNAPRYLSSILKRMGKSGNLEALTLHLTMLDDRYNWEEGEDPAEECAREYGDVLDVVIDFIQDNMAVETKVLYCSEWFDEEIDVSDFLRMAGDGSWEACQTC